MSRNSEEARARAEERFKKAPDAAEASQQAMAEYAAANRAVDEKIARLRALRLANEAAAANTPPAGRPRGPTKKP